MSEVPENVELSDEIDHDIQCEEFYEEEYSIEELFTFSDGQYVPIYENYT